MARHAFALAAAIALLAVSLGCSNSNTLSPVAGTQTFTGSLKATAPATVSPVNGQLLIASTLTATAAIPQFDAVALQYRFQIFNDAGSQVQDSGPVDSPVWKLAQGLTPNQRFTWKVRAEYQGAPGPWSTTASFQSGDPAPSFVGPIGDWQHCAGRVGILLSACVHAAVQPRNSVGALEVVKRVAWLVRGEGGGLLIKTGGENIVLWQGYSFSASRMCFSNGQLYKLIGDSGPGGANYPDFTDNGFVDPAFCVPAIDPSKP
jgi:hypothetical protein